MSLHQTVSHEIDKDEPATMPARDRRSNYATRIVLAVHEAALAGCCEAAAFASLGGAWTALVRAADLEQRGRPGEEHEAEDLCVSVRPRPEYWLRLYISWAWGSISPAEIAEQLGVRREWVYGVRRRTERQVAA